MKKVLLIDDDPLINFVTQKIIETTGIPCQIMVAMNGKQGIELLTEEKENGHQLPDIILLDINMPIVDGFEFLRQVEGLNLLKDSNSTVAIVTSSNCDRDKQMAQQFGITTFLVKPISIDVARDILTGMIESLPYGDRAHRAPLKTTNNFLKHNKYLRRNNSKENRH